MAKRGKSGDQSLFDDLEPPADAGTPGSLYAELRVRHALSFDEARLGVAVDDAIVRWDTPLREGARVAFIPPVSGG